MCHICIASLTLSLHPSCLRSSIFEAWRTFWFWLQIRHWLGVTVGLKKIFFPRASERRVLPIVGVCKTSSHLLNIFSSSHLLIFTSSLTSAHLHICSSSHLLSHLLIFTSAHLHIFSHICSSSHLLIFTSSLTSAHLHICSSSHLLSHLSSLICSSSHLLSHLLIFTSAHLHIFSHICSSLHLLIFTSSHLLMSTSSLTSAPFLSFFSLLPFLSLAFSFSRLLYLSLFRREPGQWQRDATKRNPFARNEVRSSKTEVKLRFQVVPRNPFA